MTAAAAVLATAAAFMFGYGPAFCLAVRLAERRDRKTAQPAPEPPNPPLTHPSLRTHQTAASILDRIAANEAARLDDEWAAVAKEWTR